ncbi:MAG: FtsX-like permease family protein, partial [Candidatus Heimdallarchaeota archaeon]|nr:FtsX-like permease family protein [Candidatus Heimdallarchaeota archaeon]
MFAISYAIKSLTRRKFKNLSIILAIALSVTIVVSIQIAKEGIYNVNSKAELDGFGKSDIVITNPTFEAGYFPENVVNILDNIDTTLLQKINYINPIIRHFLPVYIPETSKYERMVFINGIMPNIENMDTFTNIDGNIIDLNLLFSNSSNNIAIISSSMSEDLQLEIDDLFLTTVPNGVGNYSQIALKVADIYDDTIGRGIEGVFPPSTSKYQIYMNLQFIRLFLHESLPNSINQIDISLKDDFIDRRVEVYDPVKDTFPGIEELKSILKAIQVEFSNVDSSYNVRSPRIDLLDTIDKQLEAFTITLDVFIVLLNITSLLLIVNVQNMSVDDRKYQTAVLRALGNNKKTIVKIFLYEATIVGVIGSVIALFVGLFLGELIQNEINAIFDLSGIEPVIKPTMIAGAILFGIFLSTITAILPTLKVADIPVNEAIRGIAETKESVNYERKLVYLGLLVTAICAGILLYLGEFWKQENLTTFQDQMMVSGIVLGLITGICIVLAVLIHQRLFLTLWGSSFLWLSYYNFYITFYYVVNAPLILIVDWFMMFMYLAMVGSIIIVGINLDLLLTSLEKIFFMFPNMRATMQVSIAQLLSKKLRMILIFSILTVIILIGMFFGTVASTEKIGMESEIEYRTDGVNIVIDVQVPLPGIQQVIENIEGVTHVYGFKKARIPVYVDDPSSTHFDAEQDTILQKSIIEISEQSLKPNGEWDQDALQLFLFGVDETKQFEYDITMDENEVRDISRLVLDDFFETPSIEKPVIHTDNEDNELIGEIQTGYTALGGLYVGYNTKEYLDRMLYLPGLNSTINVGFIGGVLDMMGDSLGFGNVILLTPEVTSQLPVFQELTSPNLFLVKTVHGYLDDEFNQQIAENIEDMLNNLNPTENSLCTGLPQCILIGASSRIVHDQYFRLFERSSNTFAFFSTFSVFALVIGVLGMIIISVRSVGERTREIGMRRAIGFSKRAIVSTLAFELLVVVILGIMVGISISMIYLIFFAHASYQTDPVFPMNTIIFNILLLFISSLLAGIIPGYR